MSRINLDVPVALDAGFRRISYPTQDLDLRQEVSDLLIEKGFIDKPVALGDLHLHLLAEHQTLDRMELNGVTRAFYDTSDKFQEIYFTIIKYIGRACLNFDFLFQETPTIRFHFPGLLNEDLRTRDGMSLNHHVDSMLGHPMEEINCWLPLTKCYGSNALALSSLETGIEILNQLCQALNFDAEAYYDQARELLKTKMLASDDFRRKLDANCRPVDMEYGDIILFDSRCIHATNENTEPATRVSLDFRLIPLDAYNNLTRI